jgi:uncharacterized BrkB/YihY/UPF0761 family membrane protein
MIVVTGVALFIFGVLNLVSIVGDIFGRRNAGSNGAKESTVAYRRWIFVRLGMLVLIIGGFWAIVHFGPLRPVHEWMR